MPSEFDPLLPKNDPAPEIQGTGFSKPRPSEEINYEAPPAYHNNEDDTEDSEPMAGPTSTKSALSTIISIFTFVVFAAFLVFLFSPDDTQPQPEPLRPKPSRSISDRVSQILDDTPLFDGHNDLATHVHWVYKNHIHTPHFKHDFEKGPMTADVDLPRLRHGKVGGSFWSAYVTCPSNASNDFSDNNYGPAVSMTLSQIDLIRRLQHYYSSTFTSATTRLPDALSAFHRNHTIISPISIEGLHQVPQSSPMSTLRLYHALGVRAATLTWNCHNAFADAAVIMDNGDVSIAPPTPRNGLSPLGRRVLREMNRLGMLIDLSHTSYWTQKAVLSNHTSLAPVIYSHSSAFALCPHPRNVHDDMLDLVKKTNGLVMVNFAPDFISCLPPHHHPDTKLPLFLPQNSTLHQVARHILYVGSRIGYDHVGIGSDFDGMGPPPRGLEGVDKFPDLIAELLRMGVTDDQARKVVGGNLIRVWQAAEEVSRKMQVDGVLEEED